MELFLVRDEADRILREVTEETGATQIIPIETMIELPRAALTAARIAEAAKFFSFGTNDPTQTTWGFSRDDVEAAFFAAYLDRGIFMASPFESLDVDGVGRLIQVAVTEGRRTRPGLKIGICGEHGGDPESIHFFHRMGLATSPAPHTGCRWPDSKQAERRPSPPGDCAVTHAKA